jgi:hypothetical protein
MRMDNQPANIVKRDPSLFLAFAGNGQEAPVDGQMQAIR